MAVDPRFRHQRERVLEWWVAHAGVWYRKDQIAPGMGNGEARARRTRELVELGYLEVRGNGISAMYRMPTTAQAEHTERREQGRMVL